MYIGKWRLKVGSDIVFAVVVVVLEVAHKRYLWCDVQQSWRLLEEVARLLKPKPYHTMSLQRQAVWTEGIFARGDIPVGHKATIARTTYGTLPATTSIGKTHNGDCPICHTLKYRAWDVV
jgi:hypothetical protein